MTRYILLAPALLAAPSAAQTVANLPVTCNAAGSVCTQATPITNPDGSIVARATAPGLTTTQVSVATTATLVVAARAARIRLVITQSAAGPCYFGPTNAVSATTGARLAAVGASKLYQYSGALYGICPGGAAVVDVDEEY